MALAKSELEEAWARRPELEAAIRDLRAVTARLPGGDGDDLAQEALTRALANGVSPSTVPWLVTVARRVAIDRYRRAREVASGDGTDLERIAPATLNSPEDAVLTSEGVAAVRKALATLPSRYREALMVFVEEGSAQGVARTMNMTPHATWTLLCRARERLRRELRRVGYMPAAIVAKFGKLVPALLAGGVAVTVAAGFSLPSTRSDTLPKAPHVKRVQTSSAAAVTQAPKKAPAGRSSAPRAAPAHVKTAPSVRTPLRYTAGTCPKPGDPAPPVSVGAVFNERDGTSVTSAIGRAVPESLRTTSAGGC